MARAGLTGGIGSGKSIVCRVFATLGIPVYDSDSMARRLMDSDRGLISRIEGLLGPGSYNGGRLDRAYVASRIFGDETIRHRLNAIVHPAVTADFIRWSERMEAGGAPYTIVESAILFESGLAEAVDVSITVSAPEHIRLIRAMRRDGATAEAVEARIRSQMGDGQREALAGHVIINDGQRLVVPQVVAIDKALRRWRAV